MLKNLLMYVVLGGVLASMSASAALAAQESAKGGVSIVPTVAGTGKLSSESLIERYGKLTGSTDNANSLVNGLHTGESITLTDSAPPPPSPLMPLNPLLPRSAPTAPVSITFTPPTGAMGWGNVDIALALMEAVLKYQNIANPNAKQLYAALMNPETGVLQLRARGMGWPKIVTTLGFAPQ